jgi:hypothetical protein
MFNFRNVRSNSINEAASPAPDESPAIVILEAGTGSWKDVRGGESSDKYAISASRRADGKTCCGARRYRTDRQRPPLCFAKLDVVIRWVAGSMRL